MMHNHRKSDRLIVPAKPPNEAEPGEAKEVVEGEGLAEGKAPERNMSRTQSRSSMSVKPMSAFAGPPSLRTSPASRPLGGIRT